MALRHEEIETAAGARGGRESERLLIELDPIEADDILMGRARILTVAGDGLSLSPASTPPRAGGKTSITVSWNTPLPPTGLATDLRGFELAWRTAEQIGYPLVQRRRLEATETSVEIRGLVADTLYYVKLLAYFRTSALDEPSVLTLGP